MILLPLLLLLLLSSSLSFASQQQIQIHETEFWDGERWKAERRWTTPQGTVSVSPDRIVEVNFEGEWQIITGNTTRDAFGWEYLYQGSSQYPIRQRIWLRNLATSHNKQPLKTTTTTRIPPLLQAIRDDFNFKGCGWSFYKSLLDRDSVGVAFRVPLTSNFDFFDRRPAILPSISSAVCLYYPALAYVLVSGSLRVEGIKWVLAQALAISQYVVVWVAWTLLRGILLAASAFVFPLTRKLINPPCPMSFPKVEPPTYSRNIEERIGCSVSWRVSPKRGYEFRVSYWHYYAPTMSSIFRLLRLESPNWFARRAAVLALSTGGPTLDPPYIFSSLILGLSAFYFRSGDAAPEPVEKEEELEETRLEAIKKIKLNS